MFGIVEIQWDVVGIVGIFLRVLRFMGGFGIGQVFGIWIFKDLIGILWDLLGFQGIDWDCWDSMGYFEGFEDNGMFQVFGIWIF